jgi:hypothetical protein
MRIDAQIDAPGMPEVSFFISSWNDESAHLLADFLRHNAAARSVWITLADGRDNSWIQIA